MYIQTETTPNPVVLKFLPARVVLESGTAEFLSREAAERDSDLAFALFGISGVASVFFGHDFISVARAAEVSWDVLKPPILGVIMDHYVSGRPTLNETGALPVAEEEGAVSDDPISRKIRELLDTRVRPAVAQDGGDIVFHAFDRGIVYLTLRGACAGCPSATATLKMGVENLLRHYIPEVVEVRARV